MLEKGYKAQLDGGDKIFHKLFMFQVEFYLENILFFFSLEKLQFQSFQLSLENNDCYK